MILEKCVLNLDRNRRELQPHGSLEFPCAVFSEAYSASGQELPWHWHEEMEVILLVSGSLRVYTPGTVFLLQEGNGIFINSNTLHRACSENNCRIHSLVFHPRLVTGFHDSVFARRYVSPLIASEFLKGYLLSAEQAWQKEATNCISDAFDAFSGNETGFEFIVREKLSRLCFLVCRNCFTSEEESSKETSPDAKRIRVMLDYIHQSFDQPLSIRLVARQGKISERECLRCFQRTIQISPGQYILKYRVTQAAHMLKNSDRSVSEIALNCGFDSASNFSQLFKRFFTCTPREYRKHAQNQPYQALSTFSVSKNQ